jgi:hypothetical protein
LDFSPAQLLMNRKLRSKLPSLIEDVTAKLNLNAYEKMIVNKQKIILIKTHLKQKFNLMLVIKFMFKIIKTSFGRKV